MPGYDLVVWDFDGVLNRNIRDGRFSWTDDLKTDLGIDPEEFSPDFFGRERIEDILRGRRDLVEELDAWLARRGHDLSGLAFRDYWFSRDAMPDAQVISWLDAHPGRRVIGTNNERHRARYIAEDLGFGARVERVFASGEMGVAKPDMGFYAEIERWSGLPPARILLIDDLARNTEAASRRGWKTFRFGDDTRDRLPETLGLA
ncbi:HAD family hydrolase [Litorisediminicola beolgyonensis]|uniref:HAD family hydrolase n=1 Tax=Litorisediminicola beolgyonensis TaxID=1173614 RepID=A0ABW3ZFW1_9RHOB